MQPSQPVIVYRSQGEANFDQWYWSGGGSTVLAWLAVGFIVTIIISWIWSSRTPIRRYGRR